MRVLVIGLLVLVGTTAARADELQRLRDENAELRARIESLESDNRHLRGEADSTGLAAALRESARTTVRTERDTSGRTVVETDPSLIAVDAGPHARHWIVLRSGSASPPSADAEVVIESSASGGVYRDVAALDLAVDGVPATLARLRYASAPVTAVRGSGATFRETVVLDLPSALRQRLAKARRIEGTLGPLRFHLTPEQLALMREFTERLATAH